MALSTQWTDSQLFTWVTTELGYPAGTSSLFDPYEISQWIEDFQTTLQSGLEPVWGTSSWSLTTATFSTTALATDILRLDATYHASPTGTYRLSPRLREDIELLHPLWQYSTPTATSLPEIIYPVGQGAFAVWPPTLGGTLVFDYVKTPTYSGSLGTATTPLPPWTRNGALAYCGWKFYSRFSPVQDLPRATVYRQLHEYNLKLYKRLHDQQWPAEGLRLSPCGNAQARVLNPAVHNG